LRTIQLLLGHVKLEHTVIELHVRAEHAKDGEDRLIPITSRLASILEMARHDPAGDRLPDDAHVFGDAIGQPTAKITRMWQTCVLKAHGVKPAWDKRPHTGTDRPGHRRQGGRLTAACRETLKAIDLHFHDLRREAGSRWMEGGMPLHVVQQLLGHADARTTSIYLNATRLGLHECMQRFERVRGEVCTDRLQEGSEDTAASPESDAANLLNLDQLRGGAGDGDRTRDQQLGKL
jgi:integrase